MTKEEFSHAEAVINQERSNVFLYSVITDYYLRYGSYPESLSQLDSAFALKKNDYRYEKLMKDPFDRQNNEYLYLPLYINKTDTISHGFYLISAGIDRILNTDLEKKYTLQDTSDIPIYSIKNLSYEDDELEEKDLLIYSSIGNEPIIRNPGLPKAIEQITNQMLYKIISLDVEAIESEGQIFGRGISNATKIVTFGEILNKEAYKVHEGKMNVKGVLKRISNDTLYFSKVVLNLNLIDLEDSIQEEELIIEAID